MAYEYNSNQFESGVAVDSTTEDVGAKKISLLNVPVKGEIVIPSDTVTDRIMTWKTAPPTEVLEALTADKNFDNTTVRIDLTDTAHTPVVKEVSGEYYADYWVTVQANVKFDEITYYAEGSEEVLVKLLISGLDSPTFDLTTLTPGLNGDQTGYIDIDDEDKLKYNYVLDSINLVAEGTANVTVALVTAKV